MFICSIQEIKILIDDNFQSLDSFPSRWSEYILAGFSSGIGRSAYTQYHMPSTTGAKDRYSTLCKGRRKKMVPYPLPDNLIFV